MDTPKSIFREYDVRGIVGRELTPEFAEHLGRAYATVARERVGHAPTLAVGRDNRPSGASLAAAIRRGIVASGGDAIDIGMLPTPALYFAVFALGTDGGLQITGSHNPPEFNGFKMGAGGDSLQGEAIQRLHGMIAAEAYAQGPGRETTNGSILARYRQAIVERHHLAR